MCDERMAHYVECVLVEPIGINYCAAAIARGTPPICCPRDQTGRTLDVQDQNLPGKCEPCKGLTPPDSQ